MKKILAVLFVLMAFVSLTTLSLAAGHAKAPKAEVVKGEVTSINPLVIKTKSGELKTIEIDPALLSSTAVAVGENVKVTLKSGENKASEIVKVVKKNKGKK